MNDFREYSAAFHAKNDDILHFGILGMKWGVRRYQNPDGTLTPDGKKRRDLYNEKYRNRQRELAIQKGFKPGMYFDGSDKKAQKLARKADKYGTETLDERNERILRQAKRIEEEKEKVSSSKKVFDSLGNDLFTEEDVRNRKDTKRARAAADLGLEALNKIGRQGYDPEEGITNDDREWFVYEDQTIGLATIADLAIQGKNKKEIKDLMEAAKTLYLAEDQSYDNKHGIFQLAESYAGDDYLDALFAILNAEGKLKHSAIRKKKKKSSK